MNAKRDISNTPLWLSLKDQIPVERHAEFQARILRAIGTWGKMYGHTYLRQMRNLNRDRIIQAFNWASSPEGHEFWATLHLDRQCPIHAETMPRLTGAT